MTERSNQQLGGGVPVSVSTAAGVLREVAGFDERDDPRRAALTRAQAGLLEACLRTWPVLPVEVAVQVQHVADAVDRATGRRH